MRFNVVSSGLIDNLKKTSQFDKVSTWNWAVAPMDDENLSPDFLFFLAITRVFSTFQTLP